MSYIYAKDVIVSGIPHLTPGLRLNPEEPLEENYADYAPEPVGAAQAEANSVTDEILKLNKRLENLLGN